MAVTITESTITGESGEQETVVVAENTATSDPISIELDYTGYFDRIATAMETIATNSTTITTQLTAMADDIDNLRNLANSSGIRTIQPYGYLGSAILYLLYIKQAEILEEDFADRELQKKANKRFGKLLKEMFENFDANAGGF